MLRICPGYGLPAICGPVARLSAAQAGKKPQQCHVTAYSPGCGVNALPGLRVTSNLRPGSPAKRSANREEAAAIPRRGIFPGLPAICGLVARLSAARAGKKPQQYHVTAYSPGYRQSAVLQPYSSLTTGLTLTANSTITMALTSSTPLPTKTPLAPLRSNTAPPPAAPALIAS